MKSRVTVVWILITVYFISVVLALLLIFQPQTVNLFNRSAGRESRSAIHVPFTDAVGLIRIYGAIRVSEREGWYLPPQDADQIVKQLNEFAERKDVKAVVLRINSPGGSVAAVQEIYTAILKLKQAGKKVVASFADVAASGGYYVAVPADKIVANPGTLTGSIGVILELGNLQELFRKIGIRIETIKTGKYKDIGNISRPLTSEEKDLLQKLINNAYQQFVEAIVEGRKMDQGKVLEIADGRIFTGEQAKSVGLVDELGNLDDAIQLAGTLSGIKGKPRIVEEYDLVERFFESISASQSSRSILAQVLPYHPSTRFEYIME